MKTLQTYFRRRCGCWPSSRLVPGGFLDKLAVLMATRVSHVGFCVCQTPMCHQHMFVRCRQCKSNTLVGTSGLWTPWCYWGRAVSMPLGDPRSSAWPTTCLVFLDEQLPLALCPRGQNIGCSGTCLLARALPRSFGIMFALFITTGSKIELFSPGHKTVLFFYFGVFSIFSAF